MFTYPKQAEFNRVIPKTKIYAHAKPSKRVKGLFVAQVEEILWKYKLAPETINLPARDGILEIEVLAITLKRPDLDEAVLRAIDKAIPFPLLFHLTYADQIRFAASYKRPSDADVSKWVIEGVFQTEPQPVIAEWPPMPIALDLAGLYEKLVRSHIPLTPRAGEGIAAQVARFSALETKKKAYKHLAARLAREKQFNRKVALNGQLRALTEELASLQA